MEAGGKVSEEEQKQQVQNYSTPPCSRAATAADLGCSETERFEMELEFVQCLASPEYLNWLAQNRYFDDPAFLKYLDHLRYWKRPEYCTYITYPHCLTFLDLLQDSAFRKALARPDLMHGITWQQFHFHNHYRKNRFREAQASAAQEAAETGEADPGDAMVS